MIYRLLTNKNPIWCTDSLYRSSTAISFGVEMTELGLKAPKHVNPRARFYFTERGWEEIGKKLLEKAHRVGIEVKVIKKKNPKRSDVVWGDPYQVAVLPKS